MTKMEARHAECQTNGESVQPNTPKISEKSLRELLEEKFNFIEMRLQDMDDRLAKMEMRQTDDDLFDSVSGRRQPEPRSPWASHKLEEQHSPNNVSFLNPVPSSPFAIGSNRSAFSLVDPQRSGSGSSGGQNGHRISPPPFLCQTSDFFASPAKPSIPLPDLPEVHDERIQELLRNPQTLNLLSSLVNGSGANGDGRGGTFGAPIYPPMVPAISSNLRRSNSNKSRRNTRRFSCPDTSRLNVNWSAPASPGYNTRTASFGFPPEALPDSGPDDAFLPNDGAFRPASTVKELEIVRRFGEVGNAQGQLNAPHGFCLGKNGEIIVADTNNHRIQFFDHDGKYIFHWGNAGKRDGQLWFPRKVAFIPDDSRVVVCDRGQDRSRLQLFTCFGQYERTISVDYVAIVAGMTVYRNWIVIVDSVNPACIILDFNGGLYFWFSCQQHMKEPSDVVVAANTFYICDFKGHCVCAYNGKGEFLTRIGSSQTINFPNGISIADDGTLLVGDSHGNRFHVAAFDSDGRFLAEYECPNMKVSRCCGLVLTAQGFVITIAKNNNFVLVLKRLDNFLQSSELLQDRDGLDNGTRF